MKESLITDEVVTFATEALERKLKSIDEVLEEAPANVGTDWMKVSDECWERIRRINLDNPRKRLPKYHRRRTLACSLLDKVVRRKKKKPRKQDIHQTVEVANEGSCNPKEFTSQALQERVLACLAEHRDRDPQFQLYGDRNLWILKPGGKSRGRGIFVTDRLEEALDCARGQEALWMSQKYIENPQIINRKKFDVRQWVLISSFNPMGVWFYDNAYLRFSFDDYDKSDVSNRFAHLTNNSVAKYAENYGEESKDETMIHSDEYAEWLKKENSNSKEGKRRSPSFGKNSVEPVVPGDERVLEESAPDDVVEEEQAGEDGGAAGGAAEAEDENTDEVAQEDMWRSHLQPQMQRIAYLALSSCQDRVLLADRKNCFELVGFDFMVDEELKVWLIECNSSPDLSYSTSTTKNLVREVLTDMVAVVCDAEKYPRGGPTAARDPGASTTSSSVSTCSKTWKNWEKKAKAVDTGAWKLLYPGARTREEKLLLQMPSAEEVRAHVQVVGVEKQLHKSKKKLKSLATVVRNLVHGRKKLSGPSSRKNSLTSSVGEAVPDVEVEDVEVENADESGRGRDEQEEVVEKGRPSLENESSGSSTAAGGSSAQSFSSSCAPESSSSSSSSEALGVCRAAEAGESSSSLSSRKASISKPAVPGTGLAALAKPRARHTAAAGKSPVVLPESGPHQQHPVAAVANRISIPISNFGFDPFGASSDGGGAGLAAAFEKITRTPAQQEHQVDLDVGPMPRHSAQKAVAAGRAGTMTSRTTVGAARSAAMLATNFIIPEEDANPYAIPTASASASAASQLVSNALFGKQQYPSQKLSGASTPGGVTIVRPSRPQLPRGGGQEKQEAPPLQAAGQAIFGSGVGAGGVVHAPAKSLASRSRAGGVVPSRNTAEVLKPQLFNPFG
mmetsp:Transcript_17769/g.44427  ORF Transcript_17769/g.44427 Transcript_17769/m.44427 type:complete len:901 (+) Transcript_17769:1037-3739(+)